MPLPHPWPGKDALWELQGGQPVSPAARAPGGMRQGPAPGYPARFRPQGRCAAWPRIKHDVLGSACCTAKQPMLMMAAWCLALRIASHESATPLACRRWPAEAVAQSSWPADGCRTRAFTARCSSPNRGHGAWDPLWRTWASIAAQTARKEGRRSQRLGAVAPLHARPPLHCTLDPWPHTHTHTRDDGKHDPAICYLLTPVETQLVSAQSQHHSTSALTTPRATGEGCLWSIVMLGI